ncbi:hypothetical protein C9374_003236 [Naegleria lovaniensis]|uniref:Uncharacterized protein n=1 Tax=Naegleria lovaniensis TaxID=51637 RepID=A0AA88KLK2_NAELO|nr:uncharacterized protein C9374_003236 [Naegleria lovaniensis]KAG2385421.1 hypothetical protein C9374_003236 [Naegleria lovaniensis]
MINNNKTESAVDSSTPGNLRQSSPLSSMHLKQPKKLRQEINTHAFKQNYFELDLHSGPGVQLLRFENTTTCSNSRPQQEEHSQAMKICKQFQQKFRTSDLSLELPKTQKKRKQSLDEHQSCPVAPHNPQPLHPQQPHLIQSVVSKGKEEDQASLPSTTKAIHMESERPKKHFKTTNGHGEDNPRFEELSSQIQLPTQSSLILDSSSLVEELQQLSTLQNQTFLPQNTREVIMDDRTVSSHRSITNELPNMNMMQNVKSANRGIQCDPSASTGNCVLPPNTRLLPNKETDMDFAWKDACLRWIQENSTGNLVGQGHDTTVSGHSQPGGHTF